MVFQVDAFCGMKKGLNISFHFKRDTTNMASKIKSNMIL